MDNNDLQRTEKTNYLSYVSDTDKKTNDGHIISLFKCCCGKDVFSARSRVKNNYKVSCGCKTPKSRVIHGHKSNGVSTPTYSTWSAMRRRCLDKKDKDYYRYGGAGIGMCESWKRSFSSFLDDMGIRPKGKTIDRIDPSKGYFKENCRWSTPKEQSRNRKDLVVVNYKGQMIALVDVAKKLGITKWAAHMRYKRGKLEGVVYE